MKYKITIVVESPEECFLKHWLNGANSDAYLPDFSLLVEETIVKEVRVEEVK